ncbi:DUF1127 domain-containing protein [Inquilinus sp. CAU 1745]|uniref:DUF1127 domain-containing protein n=1 Tax=Inquilinus sp. CAU 1745 TaxID=3140369 RepID=UPI00325AA0EA
MTFQTALPARSGFLNSAFDAFRRSFGFGVRNRNRRIAYRELMNLSDRQLEDIGLTRALVETVVLQGPQSIRALNPDSSIHPAANANQAGAAPAAEVA